MIRPSWIHCALVALGVAGPVPAAWSQAQTGIPAYQKVTVALPPNLIEKSVEVHTHAPMVERIPDSEPTSLLDIPTLPRYPSFRSRFLRAMVPTVDHKSWQLLANDGAHELVVHALRRCFSPHPDDDEPWPAAVLRAADNPVKIEARRMGVVLHFARSVGPLPELLGGCMAYDAGSTRTGRFVEQGPAQLKAHLKAEDGGPALQHIDFQTQSVGADVFSGGTKRVDTSLRYEVNRNLLFLVRNEGHAGVGAWRFDDSEARARFYHAMGPQTLLDAFAGGHGHIVRGMLPSSWTTAQEGRSAVRPTQVPPLHLGALGARAPEVRIQVPLEDELAWATAERIAVLMRSVGAKAVVLPNNMDRGNAHELALLRWCPEADDDALSLLALAGRHRNLSLDEYRQHLADPRLLSPVVSERQAAARVLEAAWLNTGRLIPLLVSESWVAIHPSLRGVYVRPDGVPIFEQAYWGRD